MFRIYRSSRSKAVLLMVLIISSVVAVLAGSALAGAPAAAIPEITITGHDFTFSGPDRIEAGPVAIMLENAGHEPHQALLGRLQDGKTLDDLMAAFRSSEEAGLALLDWAGGPNTIEPGKRQRVIADLAEGTYVLICFWPSADGTQHLAKGMVKPLAVVARTGTAPVTKPVADATITLQDFGFVLPAAPKAGRQTWEVVNAGPQPHELTLIKLAPGKTLDDAFAFVQKPAGPPPFALVGGVGILSQGKRAWMDLDLQPGNYAALCFVPDPASGHQHVALGMVRPFAIPDAPATIPATGARSATVRWLSLGVVGGIVLLAAGMWLRARRLRRAS